MQSTIGLRRRSFLKRALLGTAGVTTGYSSLLAWKPEKKHPFPAWKQSTRGFDPADERYWEMVKSQYAIADGKIMVNAANLCPSPFLVHEQVEFSITKLAKDVSFQDRAYFNEERKITLDKLAEYLGVSPREVGITRNTTESNNILVHGLDLGAEDEIILWDQNHPSNGIAWEEQSRRIGFKVNLGFTSRNPRNQ